MREFWRPLLLVVLALLVPIIPFVGFGAQLEATVDRWLDPPPAPWIVAAGTIGILTTDVLLPIPSSLISTVAGAQLGIVGGTLASWLGMTLGGIFGLLLARTVGRSLAQRWISPDDLSRLDELTKNYGPMILSATRALPVLAEAALLVLGASTVRWTRLLVPLMLSNLGIALAYAVLGHLANTHGEMAWALAASIAVPVCATMLARWRLPPRDTTTPNQPTITE